MWEWIDKLRGMSEASRRRAAYTIAAGMTLFIVLVWMAVGLISEVDFYTYDTSEAGGSALSSSFKADLGRLRQAGSEQVGMLQGMWEAWRSIPQGTSTSQ